MPEKLQVLNEEESLKSSVSKDKERHVTDFVEKLKKINKNENENKNKE
jgi:hypothetical protein